ncbi:MAG: cell division protein FtsZ [Bacteroidetes bacterium]|nr:cell division protein FtsZ [Bacteroidota bacterium]MBU1719537.1 cell division protein FtsZ [Bacteroidota bacterium]
MKFDLPKDQSSIIKVIGVGGGGTNAVNHMFNQGINGVDFVICNTDAQALESSPVPNRMQLGANLTQGLGAGSIPETGRNAALETIDRLQELLEKNTKMVFITAGMGGGTGTGAAPVIASVARELDVLTVGIVTVPFAFEGKRRRTQAEEGLIELKKHVDTLLVISNEKLREMYGDLTLKNAFTFADNVLATAAKGIAELITVSGYINVDFNDVNTVMRNGGTAIMGYATAEGEDRAKTAVEAALNCPLLNDNNIKGASQVLLYITSGSKEATMDEIGEISDFIQTEAGLTANIIFGTGFDDSLEEKISVIVIATGFQASKDFGIEALNEADQKRVVINLDQSQARKEEDLGIKLIKREDEAQPVKKNQSYFATDKINKGLDLEITNTVVSTKEQEAPPVNNNTSNPPLDEAPELPEDKKTESETTQEPPVNKSIPSQMEEQHRKQQERISRLRQMSTVLKNSSTNLNDMEKEPAYIRKQVRLDPVTPSSESHVSKYTLTEGDDNRAELKKNNGYLHDKPD